MTPLLQIGTVTRRCGRYAHFQPNPHTMRALAWSAAVLCALVAASRLLPGCTAAPALPRPTPTHPRSTMPTALRSGCPLLFNSITRKLHFIGREMPWAGLARHGTTYAGRGESYFQILFVGPPAAVMKIYYAERPKYRIYRPFYYISVKILWIGAALRGG